MRAKNEKLPLRRQEIGPAEPLHLPNETGHRWSIRSCGRAAVRTLAAASVTARFRQDAYSGPKEAPDKRRLTFPSPATS